MYALKSYVVAPACLLAFAAWAHAVPTLLIYDVQNGAIQVIQDNVASPGNDAYSTQLGGQDSNVAVDAVTYVGTVGDWTVDINADVVGDNVVNLDGTVTSDNATSAPEELYVAFDADGIPADPLGTPESTSVSGNLDPTSNIVPASFAILSYATATDPYSYITDELGDATLINPPDVVGPLGPGAFSSQASGSVPASSSSYSLVSIVDIQGYGVGGTNTFNDSVQVPDQGSTAALFGVALLALCLARRRQPCRAR